MADVVIIFGVTKNGVGKDRSDLNLEDDVDSLIEKVSEENSNIVVVISAHGPVLTPWKDSVKGILLNFMPGE